MDMGLVVLAIAIRGVFEFLQESLVGGVVGLVLFDIRNLFFCRAIRMDVARFGEHGTHELMSRFTNDVETMGTGLKTLYGRVVAEPLRALACIVVACFISWQLTLLFLVLVPISLYILTRVGKMMKRATRKVLEGMTAIFQILQESFQGIRIIKGFCQEPCRRRKFREATREYYRRSQLVVNLDALSGPIIETLGVAAIAGALLVGAYLVLEKETKIWGLAMSAQPLEMESLLQLYALLAAIADPVRKLSSVFTKIQAGAAASDRVFSYMERERKVLSDSSADLLRRHGGAIEFQNICFSYDPGHPILSGVNLRVEHGQIVALVGKNGCGKSTLLNLLPRFYDPDHGQVLIDGVDVRGVNMRSLRKQIGIVTQETFLFADTIHNNIAFGKPRATREEVEQAARQANAHDFIVRLPHGYETRLGEAGLKISVGQRQKLCLARAMITDPAILLLDEFTSAADAESEMEIHRVLRDFMKGRTCFVITHRLNTLEVADRIIVIDGGKVAAEGSHLELMRISPLYQRLYEAHFQRRAA
jgi:ATP-binding cassette subfamily B protein/subfamily B ATP-binding cassette protein MsbA